MTNVRLSLHMGLLCNAMDSQTTLKLNRKCMKVILHMDLSQPFVFKVGHTQQITTDRINYAHPFRYIKLKQIALNGTKYALIKNGLKLTIPR